MNRDHSEKVQKRFEVLNAIYSDTNGDPSKVAIASEISATTGIPHEELLQILMFLQAEDLIHPLVLLGPYSPEDLPIQILHKGVVEVETAKNKPNEPTQHFPAQIFNITNNAAVSAQQFGNHNTLNQRSDLAETAAEIQRLLKQLSQSYPTETLPEKAVVAEEAIKRIEAAPTFRERVVGVLRTVTLEAFKEAIDHPLASILVAGIESWREGK